MLERRDVESFASSGSWRIGAQIIDLSCVRGGLHSCFVAAEETGKRTSPTLPDVALVNAAVANVAQQVCQR